MKNFNYIQISLLMLVSLSMTSCLKSGLETLPLFDEVEITDVKFDFRFKDMADISPLDGQPIVKVVPLTIQDLIVDHSNATVTLALGVPEADESFTADVRNTVELDNIVGKFHISAAALITPLDDSPALGIPGDFSAPRAYRVTAADGTTKDYTVHVTEINK